MKVSLSLRSPVVSLLAPSIESARLSLQFLKNLFPSTLESITLTGEEDELDRTLRVPIPGSSTTRWESLASKCTSSGAILHVGALTSRANKTNDGQLSLLGVTDSQSTTSSDAEKVQQSRDLIASHIRGQKGRFVRTVRLMVQQVSGRPIAVSDLLGLETGLPLLIVPTGDVSLAESEHGLPKAGSLKEVAIPHYDDSVYPDDGQTLLSRLGSSPALRRPAVGLYQWPDGGGLVIRPLPSAKEDRVLPSPSLVFYCENLEQASNRLSSLGASSQKIGYNHGLQRSGQLMVSHPTLLGLDVRLTDNPDYTSAFPEAQEALLASSLNELQNVNVLGGEQTDDHRVNEGDCWVEFRANMKRPSGFVKRGGKVRRMPAKAPDLPYE